MFHERQATFEHKPWVESELRKLRIPVIPWRYYSNEDRTQLEEYVAGIGAVVLRANRSDGGAGLCVIRDRREVLDNMPDVKDGFFAAAPLLEPQIPVNINACIFDNGGISIHPPSLQLIGIEGCTRRRFGYCGNDFSAVKSLPRADIEKLESLTLQVGQWLYSQGYRGAFGIDALFHESTLLLTEVNPRFQGSSLLSARLDRKLGRPDVVLCHLAAYLRRPAPPQIPLFDLVSAQDDCSQILLHNTNLTSIPSLSCPLHDDAFEIELPSAPGITILPNATLLRLIARRSVTTDGNTLQHSVIQGIAKYLRPVTQQGAREHYASPVHIKDAE